MGERATLPKRNFVTAQYLAAETGYTVRWLTGKAAAGEIPGANKRGRHWRFDEARFWAWWHKGDRECPSTSAARKAPTGFAYGSTVKKSGDPLAQAISELLRNTSAS